MASVRQWPNGRWQLIVYTGNDSLTGKKLYQRKTVDADDKRQAELKANEWELDLLGGTLTGASGTFDDLFDKYLKVGARKWAPSTLRKHRTLVDTYLRPALGSKKVDHRVRTETLDQLYGDLAERGGKDGAPLAVSTVNRLHAVISGALALAVRYGWIRHNPARGAEPGEVLAEEVSVPAGEDVILLLAIAEKLDSRLAVHLALAIESGARRGAMHALRWSYWTGPRPGGLSEVRFPKVISLGPEGMVERPASRRKATGRATLGPHVTTALTAHHDRMFDQARQAGEALPSDAFMFSNDILGGRPWHPDTTSHRFARLRSGLSLDGTKLHHLRHLMATQLLAAGVSPKVVGERGGWGQLHTMLGRYAHTTPASDTAAAGVVDRILNPEN